MSTCPHCGTTGYHFRWSTRDVDGLWVLVCLNTSCGREFRVTA